MWNTLGSIYSLDVPGQHIVVVNTFEAAADLFGKMPLRPPFRSNNLNNK